MNKAQVLHAFWNGFGLPAYEESTVPEGTQLPYITYEVATGSFDDGDIPLSANLWYPGFSWGDIQEKADQISDTIGIGGVIRATDTGYVWIKRSALFSQHVKDINDNIRRILLNVSVEYLDQ